MTQMSMAGNPYSKRTDMKTGPHRTYFIQQVTGDISKA